VGKSGHFYWEIQAMMRSFTIAAFVVAMMLQLCAAGTPGGKSTATAHTFTGEITESLCPKTHDEMMKEMKNMRMDKATCERTCVQMGAKYAFYDSENEQVYRFDDPKKVELYAGRKVRIIGSLKKNTIAVENVEAID
jgi:hypothetical protein